MLIENCGVVKSTIKSERDLHHIGRKFTTFKIFVTIESKHHGPSFYESQLFRQLGIHDMRQYSFINLMASPGVYDDLFSYGG